MTSAPQSGLQPAPEAIHPAPGSESRYSRLVFLFFCGFLILFSSGRLSSNDAGNQLRAAILFMHTGHLGAADIPGIENDRGSWVVSPSGRLYEPHDIGNVLLMCPSALLVNLLPHPAFRSKLASPPILGKLAVSFTYTLFSALGCWFFYRLARLFHPRGWAFLLSFGFLVTTFFWAYTKTAFDVLGACVGTCMLLYYVARALQKDEITWQDTAWCAFSLVVLGSFRVSVLPFMTVAVAACFFFLPRRPALRPVLVGATVLVLGMLPTLYYNYVRMGSMFKPATTADQFASTGSLTGSELPGLYGNLISPNKGFLEFNPILLLLLVLPLLWRHVDASRRMMIAAFGVLSFLYITAIAKVPSWASVSWGPRYLLPVLPVFCFAALPCVSYLWAKHKGVLLGVTVLSLAVSTPPALVNWHLASSENKSAVEPFASLPYQQMAVWHGLGLGLEGRPLPQPAEIAADPIRSKAARFPDIWTFRLMETSKKGLLVGWVILLSLLVYVLWSGYLLISPVLGRRTAGMTHERVRGLC